MSFARTVNSALEGATGLRLVRRTAPRTAAASAPPPPKAVLERTDARAPRDRADRLVTSPVFVLSSARAGSTLLRAILDSHSQIRSPIELHFRRLTVNIASDTAKQAMDALDLDFRDLEHLLWDRLLHRQLQQSGKRIIVEKTPSNVFVVERLARAWPDARFIYLLRNPVASALSWHEGDPEKRPMDSAIRRVAEYVYAVEAARTRWPGLTIRYEALVSTPEAVTRSLCGFLDVPWEAGMLEYGSSATGREAEFVKGIGDWSAKIRSGRIQPARVLPESFAIPPQLLEIARAWDYAPA